MNTKILIDCVTCKTVFKGPSAVGVSLAFATTKIGSLGFTKHTVLSSTVNIGVNYLKINVKIAVKIQFIKRYKIYLILTKIN